MRQFWSIPNSCERPVWTTFLLIPRGNFMFFNRFLTFLIFGDFFDQIGRNLYLKRDLALLKTVKNSVLRTLSSHMSLRFSKMFTNKMALFLLKYKLHKFPKKVQKFQMLWNIVKKPQNCSKKVKIKLF